MAFSHVLTQSVETSGVAVTGRNTYSGSSQVRVDESITTGQTDKQINVALDVSAIKSIIIKSDVAVLVETNSGGSPADSISLLAGVPYIWNTDSYDTCKLTVDVTALFITNASGSTSTFTLDAIVDATP